MERRYRETESQSVREELTKFMATTSCPECAGTRLRKSARNVFIDNKRIEDIVCMPVGNCADYFDQLNLVGRQGEIAEKIIKEIRERFTFLVDVGLHPLEK